MTTLSQISQRFGWPSVKQITNPSGSGPSIITQSVAAKIGKNLSAQNDDLEINTGALFANPKTDKTEPPLAIVCEFNRSVNNETLLDAQRLAWNFSKSPLLITIEPSRIISWSCETRPTTDLSKTSEQKISEKIISYETIGTQPGELDLFSNAPIAEAKVSKALSWIHSYSIH